jgi:hypothetical protein
VLAGQAIRLFEDAGVLMWRVLNVKWDVCQMPPCALTSTTLEPLHIAGLVQSSSDCELGAELADTSRVLRQSWPPVKACTVHVQCMCFPVGCFRQLLSYMLCSCWAADGSDGTIGEVRLSLLCVACNASKGLRHLDHVLRKLSCHAQGGACYALLCEC